jgi:LmbE family N-acetylglucosaminyl deacetylase
MDDRIQLDVMAVGAHPDDVEIACGGTLAKLARQGYRVGIVDLTDGEPTPGSPGPEVRLAEARRAAEVLGASLRLTLDLPNRRLFDGFEARVALAKVFRRHRPRLVIGLGAATPLASPDHYQAHLITEAAVFYCKLTKWEQHFGALPAHTVPVLLYCFLAFRQLSPTAAGGVVVDIGDTLDEKMTAIACYQTQFGPVKAHHLEGIRAYARQQGMAAGFEAGELLAAPGALGTRDLMSLLFGPRPPG